MPLVETAGRIIAVDRVGTGPPVVLVSGTGSAGRVWHLHQVPALTAAGFGAVTFDNRGVAPGPAAPFGVAELVADTAAVIRALDVGPVPVIGVSMGAHVVAELALAHPELVDAVALLATRGRSDVARAFFREADRELLDTLAALPPRFAAMVRAQQNLSPRTLDDDAAMRDWLDTFTLWPIEHTPGLRAQLDVDVGPGRLAAYRGITARTLVVGFGDDLVLPPHLGAEVAAVIPGARWVVVPDCGHYGYLERPDAVNAVLLEFLGSLG